MKNKSQIHDRSTSAGPTAKGESAGARNRAGNHTGPRLPSPKRPKLKH